MTEAPAWPAGTARLILDETDSTNAHALREAARLPAPAWLLARRQTAGRGRRGRAWASPEGAFAATLLLRPDCPPAEAAQHSFLAGLALHDALAPLAGPGRLALKWPNDLLLDGAKLGGILLESLSGPGGRVAVLAIGIGVNLAAPPPAAALAPEALPAASLAAATGAAPAPEALLDRLAPAFAARAAEMAAGGFAPIRAAWLARAAGLGAEITARTGAQTRRGRFEGLAPDGALLLATAAGREAIPAADIHW